MNKNLIVGCISIHPSMELSEFNNQILPIFLKNSHMNNIPIILLEDFNVNTLNYHVDSNVSDFLEEMYCNSFYHSSRPRLVLLQDCRP